MQVGRGQGLNIHAAHNQSRILQLVQKQLSLLQLVFVFVPVPVFVSDHPRVLLASSDATSTYILALVATLILLAT